MKKSAAMVLCMLLLFSTSIYAAKDTELQQSVNQTATFLCQTASDPQIGSVGGEWTVLGLARSGAEIPETYFQKYYQNVESYVKSVNGVLHEKKYTEYSRVILALTAIGKDPTNVAGFNLLLPLGDYEKTIWQGINGPIWALIALDSANYEIPQNPDAQTQATRDLYLRRILDCQNPDGGWSLTSAENATSDPDVTAMALQALAKYQNNSNVSTAIEKALTLLSSQQDSSGGYASWDQKNAESTVQVLVALGELGIPVTEPRFVKNDNTILDHILSYARSDGSFSHSLADGASNLMATEQCFYGLVSALRAEQELSSLYRMGDVTTTPVLPSKESGLSGKHTDVQAHPVQYPGKTFSDISGHKNQAAIEALAGRGIINGRTEDTFVPEDTMTRAEFATILVRGLGLPEKASSAFTDLAENDWFAAYVHTAYAYKLVNGTGDGTFTPYGTLTREEAITMVARAAALCGMYTDRDTFSAQLTLAGFLDYPQVSDWALSACAFCSEAEILDNSAMYLEPRRAITRAEVAEMLYRMLGKAELL
ncbi:MAG: S-layer homology domain-containing protein [Clostridia bacterium]|nr:S-layer homology domain-containing protein [Clostridia bacterium]